MAKNEISALHAATAAYCYSKSKIADMLRADRRTVEKTIRDAGIGQSEFDTATPTYPISAVARAMFKPANTTQVQLDPEKMGPKDRRDYFASENERIKMEMAEHSAVKAMEVRKVLVAIVKGVTQALDLGADMFEREADATGEQVQWMIGFTDSIRDNMAIQVAKQLDAMATGGAADEDEEEDLSRDE